MKIFSSFRGSSVSHLILGVALVSPLLYAGCNYQVYKSGTGHPNTVGKLQPSEVPSFETVCQQVTIKNCEGCHQQKGLFSFEDYNEVFKHKDEIIARVKRVHPKPMPPMDTMTAQEKTLLIGWLEAGAPKEKPQPGQTPAPTPTPTPTATPEPPPFPMPVYHPGDLLPSFEQLKTLALEQKCLNCHDGVEESDLGKYELFAAKSAEIKDRLTRGLSAKGHMPKGKKPKQQLTKEEYDAILLYIDGGMPVDGAGGSQPPGQTAPPAPEPKPTTPAPAPAPSAGELKPTYSSIYSNIFESRCVKCHTAPKLAGKTYPLGDLAGIMLADAALTKKDAESSKLIKAVTRTDEDRMPPPKKGEPLTQAEVEILKQWISLGCPQ